MSARARIAAFVALLAVVFAGAALVGVALDPGDDEADTEHDGAGQSASGHAAPHTTASEDTEPAGVASAHGGHRLVVERTRFAAGRPAELRFSIVDDANQTVREFEVEQARRMHLILVRRDLRRYQHLHPVQGDDGAWSVDLTLPDAGVYRAFADFRTAGEQHTLGADLFVPGAFAPLDLPAASEQARTDGYDVMLHERDTQLSFAVSRDGQAVDDLQPYLGARGHLVILREGDLAYTHVHPTDPTTGEIAFHTGAIEPGTYRLFLQFRHGERVHTAAFTRTVP